MSRVLSSLHIIGQNAHTLSIKPTHNARVFHRDLFVDNKNEIRKLNRLRDRQLNLLSEDKDSHFRRIKKCIEEKNFQSLGPEDCLRGLIMTVRSPKYLDLVEEAIRHIRMNNVDSLIWTSWVSRLYREMNQASRLYEIMINPNDARREYFTSLASYRDVMDMLYDAGRYDEVIKLYTSAQERFRGGKKVRFQELAVYVVASCAKIGTQEALEMLLKMPELFQPYELHRKAIIFQLIGYLAYKICNYSIAVEFVSHPYCIDQIVSNGIATLALLRLKRYNDVVILLRNILAKNEETGYQLLTEDVGAAIRDELDKIGDIEVRQSLSGLLTRATECCTIHEKNLENMIFDGDGYSYNLHTISKRIPSCDEVDDLFKPEYNGGNIRRQSMMILKLADDPEICGVNRMHDERGSSVEDKDGHLIEDENSIHSEDSQSSQSDDILETLKNLITIASTPEHLNLIEETLKNVKYMDRNTRSLSQTVTGLYCEMDQLDRIHKILTNPEDARRKFFNWFLPYREVMKMLYKAGRYDDVIKLGSSFHELEFNILSSLVFASYARIETPKALKESLEIFKRLETKNSNPNLGSIILIGYLAYKTGDDIVALHFASHPIYKEHIVPRSIATLALLRQKRFDDLIKLFNCSMASFREKNESKPALITHDTLLIARSQAYDIENDKVRQILSGMLAEIGSRHLFDRSSLENLLFRSAKITGLFSRTYSAMKEATPLNH